MVGGLIAGATLGFIGIVVIIFLFFGDLHGRRILDQLRNHHHVVRGAYRTVHRVTPRPAAPRSRPFSSCRPTDPTDHQGDRGIRPIDASDRHGERGSGRAWGVGFGCTW